MSDLAPDKDLEARIREVCGGQSRYPVLFVYGPPRSGKSQLVRGLCERAGWCYLDYTNDPEGLELIRGREQTYDPETFLADMRDLSAKRAEQRVIVLDEIEPLLSRWRRDKQELFFRLIGRATGLAAGVVVVTRLWSSAAIAEALRPDADRVFELR